MVAEFVKVSTTLEVPPGVMKMVQVAGQEVCLANVDGQMLCDGKRVHPRGRASGPREARRVRGRMSLARIPVQHQNRPGNAGSRLKP